MFKSKPTSVATVLAAFTQTIQDLKAVDAHHENEATYQQQLAITANAAAKASTAEVAKANQVVAKLENLLA